MASNTSPAPPDIAVMKHNGDVPNEANTAEDADDQAAMEAIGKKPAFTRRFNFWTAMAITICMTGTWEGICAVLVQALSLGGPVGLLYGYILTAICMTCVAASLAELASIWPSSGAQYHWTAELSPPKFRGVFSWLAGWISIGYLWLATVSCAMGVGVQIQSYIIVANPGYLEKSERWHVYLIYVIVCIIYLFLNLFGMKLLHSLNVVAMAIHVVGYIITITLLPAMTHPKHDSAFVFTEFINNSGWTYDGIAFCAGIMTSVYGFGGIESAAHFAEEIKHVSKSLPRAMFWTVAVNGLLILPWIIVLLYCLGDLDTLLASPIALTSPITVVYQQATSSAGGAIALSCISSYLAFVGGIDSMGGVARTIWAMARDDAFPAPFRKLHPTLNVPIWCIIASFIPQLLIGIIYIFNLTAFYGLISGVLALYTLSYMVPIALHLLYARKHLDITYGPWNLGRFGWAINTVAVIWSIFIFIFLCFPLYQPLIADNMNYAIVIIGAFALISAIVYVAYGRGRFLGPVVEIIVGDPTTDEKSDTMIRVTTIEGKANSTHVSN